MAAVVEQPNRDRLVQPALHVSQETRSDIDISHRNPKMHGNAIAAEPEKAFPPTMDGADAEKAAPHEQDARHLGSSTDEQEDEQGPSSPTLPRARFLMLGTGLGFGLFLSMLDSSIVATSLYTIAADFKEIHGINWVALAYSLTYLSCPVLFARISDVVGRKEAFLAAFAIFIAFSLGCGFCQNLQQLIACRALQGVGGSGLYSLTMIIFPELTPDHQKPYVGGIIGIVLAVAGVLGPILGGILTEYASWRWVFWLNGPVGGVAALVFLFTWPEQKYLPVHDKRKWAEVDFLGSFLLIAAAVLIVFPFQNSSADVNEWSKAIFLAPLLLGILSLFALFAWQFYSERRWHGERAAAIPLVLLRNHVYAATILNTLCMGFPYLLSVYIFPNRFQVVNGQSPLYAGVMLLPMLGSTALGSAIGGLANGNKNRLFETVVVACIFMLLGCGLETTASSDLAIEPKLMGFLVFIGLGFGLSASSSTMIAIFESPIREHAPAQAIIAQVRTLGGSLGIAASSAILGVRTRSALTGVVTEAQLAGLGSKVSNLSPEQWTAIRTVYTDAFREDMIICCAVLTLALVCSMGIYRRNRPSIPEQEQNRYREERQRKETRDSETVLAEDTV
ncbi:major facilitator superfamily transporter [Podospora appendiculata]|uniref:Major facilitator superfamily transporter n=1 Tax=Podospora appendiculata TaxID=314037 RepID=A0AAE0X9C2_9PEZI|nr:major facilitator superfamily transporter [Podospora appendiculata]